MVLLNLILLYCIHESCFGSCLNRCTVERQMLRCTVIADEMCQCVSNVIAINLLDWVAGFESTVMRIQLASDIAPQRLYFAISHVCRLLAVQSFHSKHTISLIPSGD
jgi:hypothetical protein